MRLTIRLKLTLAFGTIILLSGVTAMLSVRTLDALHEDFGEWMHCANCRNAARPRRPRSTWCPATQ